MYVFDSPKICYKISKGVRSFLRREKIKIGPKGGENIGRLLAGK